MPTSRRSFARALDVPKVSLMTYSLPLVIHFLANGPFITVFPNSVMHLHANRHSLKALPVGVTFPPWPVAIVTLKNRTLSPVVERFIECARELANLMGTRGQPAGKRGQRAADRIDVNPA